MITSTGNSKQLNILLTNTNRALAEVLKNATPNEIQTLSQSRDLKSILNSLLTQSSQNPTNDKALLELLKNNPTLKSLGSATDNIKALLNAVKSDKNPLPIETTLKSFLTNIKELSETALKQKFENSGIFLESKLKNATPQNAKELIANDLKSILLKAADEIANATIPNKNEILRHVDKLLLQIDYHQLLSHLSNSSSLYLPFSWEDMQEGQINLKKGKDDRFQCDIDLKLKEYGALNIRLTLYEKNQLSIHIHSDDKEFKELIKENISSLRLALTENKIVPKEIRLLDLTKADKPSTYEDNSETINMGFEVKV